jgi:hypothetical protein
MTVIIGAVAVLTGIATFQGGGDISRWAAISTIWILIPLMALLFVILILACGVVYLLGSLLKVSPRYTGIAQEYVLWFNAQIMLWTDRIIQPILKIKSWLSMFSREK